MENYCGTYYSDTCIIIAALHTAGKHMENSIVAAICSFIVILTLVLLCIAALHTAGKHMENSIVAAYVLHCYSDTCIIIIAALHTVGNT